MIDYISIYIPRVSEQKIKELGIKFDYRLNSDAEIKKRIGHIKLQYSIPNLNEYKGLRLIMFYKEINGEETVLGMKIQGSLHKFWHGVNYTDLVCSEVHDCLKFISDLFNAPSSEMQIKYFEFGVNMEADRPPLEIVNCYQYHRGANFEPMLADRGTGRAKGVRCQHSDYKIKAYDKGGEYGLKRNIVRFEIGVKKMRWVNNKKGISIKTAEDLMYCNEENYNGLKDILIKTYNDILKRRFIDLDAIPEDA